VRKARIILIVLVGLATVIAIILFLVGFLIPKSAGLLVESNPSSMILIDGQQVGRTPYEATRKSGEIVLKLVPESFDKPLAPYEVKVTLVSGVQTVITRDFGETEEASSGEIISFEKIARGETSMAVVSSPDSAQITLDGQVKGFAPYKTSSLSPGDHKLSISAAGYLDRVLDMKTYNGYKLTVIAKLAASGQKTTQEEEKTVPEKEQPKIDYVEIISTPTGFLRVRSEPSTLASEVGQVRPGERYELVEVDEKTGWFKIKLDGEKTGWVSNQYAKKIEGDSNLTPTPTKKVTPTPTPSLKVTPTPTKKISPTPSPTV